MTNPRLNQIKMNEESEAKLRALVQLLGRLAAKELFASLSNSKAKEQESNAKTSDQ